MWTWWRMASVVLMWFLFLGAGLPAPCGQRTACLPLSQDACLGNMYLASETVCHQATLPCHLCDPEIRTARSSVRDRSIRIVRARRSRSQRRSAASSPHRRLPKTATRISARYRGPIASAKVATWRRVRTDRSGDLSRRHRKRCRCAPATGLCVGTPARHGRALAAACRRSHDPSSACGGTAGPIFLGSDCPARGHRPLQSVLPGAVARSGRRGCLALALRASAWRCRNGSSLEGG